jgi:predicted amidohydrolase YtcJ
VIQRDSAGEPTGILLENAVDLVSHSIPPLPAKQLANHILDAQQKLWRFGLTSVHDFDGQACLQALQILRQQVLLGLRVVKHVPHENLETALGNGLRTGMGDAWIRTGNVKLFADGALGPRTAAMLEPYASEPQNRGLLLMDRPRLFDTARTAVEGGFALAIHAIGDRANREVLDAYQDLRAYEVERHLPRLRHRIEHLQLLHPEDLARPGRLGIVASMQPIHATSDMLMADRYWGERVHTAYAWRSQLDSGAVLAFGSDAPVESPNPFLGIHAAVTRRRGDGGPGPNGWVPEERVSLADALAAYTRGPAFASGQEDALGRLAPGFLADLIVLDSDPFACPPEAIAALRPVATMVDGVWRYRTF